MTRKGWRWLVLAVTIVIAMASWVSGRWAVNLTLLIEIAGLMVMNVFIWRWSQPVRPRRSDKIIPIKLRL